MIYKILLSIVLLPLLFTISIAQQKFVDADGRDILAFTFVDDSISILNDPLITQVYNSDKLIVVTQLWAAMGTWYFTKEYSFFRGGDTMKISCYWGQERNFILQNLKFKKGHFLLKVKKFERTLLEGKDISSDAELNSTLFKDAYMPWNKPNPSQYTQNEIFERIKFCPVNVKNKELNIWSKIN